MFGSASSPRTASSVYGTNTHLEEFAAAAASHGAGEVRLRARGPAPGRGHLPARRGRASRATARPTTTTAACYSFRVKSRIKDVGVYRPRAPLDLRGGVCDRTRRAARPSSTCDEARPRVASLGPRVPPLSRDLAATRRAPRWRAAGRQVVFTNGCFDLLHAGPRRACSRRPAPRATCWWSAINTDASVQPAQGRRPAGDPRARARRGAARAGGVSTASSSTTRTRRSR